MIQNSIIRQVMLCTIAIAFTFFSSSSQGEQNIVWGQITNNLRLGVSVTKDWRTNVNVSECLCKVFVQNVGTNSTTLRFGPINGRDNLELRTSDGQEMLFAPGDLASHMNRRSHPSLLITNGITGVNWFFLADVFKIQTNGVYTLIISERATTKNILAREPTYFNFPPVTNTFDFPP